MSKTTKSVTEQELLDVALPEQTETYTVISHEFAITKVKEGLALAGFEILEESYRANHDGTVARGTYHIEQGDDPEMQMMFTWINSYDKSTKFQCGVGAVSAVNSSYMLTKDMINFIRKHTGEALEEVEKMIADQIAKADVFFAEMIRDKQLMSTIEVEDNQFGALLGKMFVNADILSAQQISAIKQEFKTPNYQYSTGRNSLWTMYNHILCILKSAHPKNFFKQLTTIHAMVQVEFNLVGATYGMEFDEEEKDHTVWVGGAEVTDNLVTKTEAEEIAQHYQNDGHDDVAIQQVGEESDISEELVDKPDPDFTISKNSLTGHGDLDPPQIDGIPNGDAMADTVDLDEEVAEAASVEPIYVPYDDVKEWNPSIEGDLTQGMTITLGTNEYQLDELMEDDGDVLCKLTPLTAEKVEEPVEQVTSVGQEFAEQADETIVIHEPQESTEPAEQMSLFSTVKDAADTSSTPVEEEEVVIVESETTDVPSETEEPNMEFNLEEEPVAEEPVVEEFVEDPKTKEIIANELESLLGEPQEFTYTLNNGQFVITLADQSIVELDAEYIALLEEA